MRIFKFLFAGLIVLLLIVILAAPLGPLPGVIIGGEATPPPAIWQDTSNVDEIKLRVPGTPPRVVILWVIDQAGKLYVVGAPDSGWVTMLGEGGPVDMRLGDATYTLRAEPVSQGWESIFTAYLDKYRPGYPDIVAGMPMPSEPGQIAVYRLARN